MKTCTMCLELKPFKFYTKKRESLNSRCRACCKILNDRNRDRPGVREAGRKKAREYYRNPEKKALLESAKRALISDPEYLNKRRAKREEHRKRPKVKHRERLHCAVKDAVRRGTLTRGACAHGPEGCRGAIQGHHSSYRIQDKLRVVWLCLSHHRSLHTELTSRSEDPLTLFVESEEGRSYLASEYG